MFPDSTTNKWNKKRRIRPAGNTSHVHQPVRPTALPEHEATALGRLDTLYARKEMRNQKLTKKLAERVHMVNSILALGSLVFLAIGLKNLDNYQHPIFFALLFLLIGTFPGFLLHRLLSAFIPRFSIYQNPKGTGTLLPLLFITSQVTFGVGAIVNERIGLQIESKEYIILDKGTSASKSKAYYIFIDRNGQQERLEVGRQLYGNLNIREPIKLSLVTGRLGFKYYQFPVPENQNNK